jgi:hypothetical protein
VQRRAAAVIAFLACLLTGASARADAPPTLSVAAAGGAPTFVQGHRGTLTFAVTDAGRDTSAGDTVSVHVAAPAGLTLTGLGEHGDPLSPTTWQCAAQLDGSGTCTSTVPISGSTAPAIDATFAVGAAATPGTVPIGLSSSDGADVDVATTQLAYAIAPASTLVFASPAVSGSTTAPAILGPMTLVVKDASGNLRSVDSATTVTLSSSSAGGGFATSAGGAATTTLTIPPGASSASFFYADTLPGVPRLIASAPGLFAAGQVETVTLGPAAQVAFTSAPASGVASGAATLGPIAVQVQDAYANPVPVGGETIVHLSTSSAHGWFAATRGGAHVTSVVIPSAASSAVLWYGDTAGGTPILRASIDGLATAEQGATVSGGSGLGASSVALKPRLTLTVSPHSPLRYRSRSRWVTLTAHVAGAGPTPGGTVTFTTGPHALCTRRLLRAGATRCRIHVATALRANGLHPLSAAYSGSASYAARVVTVHYRVRRVRG